MSDEIDRQEKLAQLARLKQMGEKSYDDMYEVHSQHDVDSCYRDSKDYFYDAIGIANQLGLAEESKALNERLLHIKAVYRGQFFH